jgi:hypothetical protein
MKICPMGGELLHADGQTDMKKLTVAFCNFAKSPRNKRRNTHCRQTIEDVITKDVGTYSNFCTLSVNNTVLLLTLLSFSVSTKP